MLQNPKTLKKRVREIILLRMLHEVVVPDCRHKRLRMHNSRLLPSLVRIDTVIDGNDVVELVGCRHTLALEARTGIVHVKHRLNGEHLALRLILKANQVRSRPAGCPLVEACLDQRGKLHHSSRMDGLDASKPGILARVKIQHGDNISLALARTLKSQPIQLSLELLERELGQGGLGDLLLAFGLMTRTGQRSLGGVFPRGSLRTAKTAGVL